MNTSCLVLSSVYLGQITPLNFLPLSSLISFDQSTAHPRAGGGGGGGGRNWV